MRYLYYSQLDDRQRIARSDMQKIADIREAKIKHGRQEDVMV